MFAAPNCNESLEKSLLKLQAERSCLPSQLIWDALKAVIFRRSVLDISFWWTFWFSNQVCSCSVILFPGQCAVEKLKYLCVAADNPNLRSLTAAVGEDEKVKELWKEGEGWSCVNSTDQNDSNNSYDEGCWLYMFVIHVHISFGKRSSTLNISKLWKVFCCFRLCHFISNVGRTCLLSP